MAHEFQFDTVPGDGPLTAEDLAAQEASLDFDDMITSQQNRQFEAEERMAKLRLDRLRQENAQVADQLGQVSQEKQELAEEAAFLRGQLQASQNTQAAQRNVLPPELEFDQEELTIHGEAKDFVSKAARREVYLERQKIESAIRADFQKELDALRQTTEAQSRQLAAQQAATQSTLKGNFKSDLRNRVAALGLDLDAMAADERFVAFAARKFAPGSSVNWGSILKDNIDNQRLDETMEMIRVYAKSIGATQSNAESMQVPSGTGARPLTPQGRKNHELREALMQKVDKMQQDFIDGRYEGSRDDYVQEKAALIDKIDEIPTI